MKIAVCFLSTIKNHFNLNFLKEQANKSNLHHIDIYEYINKEDKLYINLGKTVYFQFEYLRNKLNYKYYYCDSNHDLNNNSGMEFLPFLDMYKNHKDEYDFYIFYEDDLSYFNDENFFDKINFDCDIFFTNKRINVKDDETWWWWNIKAPYHFDDTIKEIYHGSNNIYGANNNFLINFSEFIKINYAYYEMLICTFALNNDFKVNYLDDIFKIFTHWYDVFTLGKNFDLIHPVKSIEKYKEIKNTVYLYLEYSRFGNYIISILSILKLYKDKNYDFDFLNIIISNNIDDTDILKTLKEIFNDKIKFISENFNKHEKDCLSWPDIIKTKDFLLNENVEYYKKFINEDFYKIDKKIETVIHLRLTDYLWDYKKYQILNKEYIENIINENNLINTSKIVISDDISTAKKILGEKYIYSNNDFIYDFKLLLNAKWIIASCSTFSVLGGIIGNAEKIFLPYPFTNSLESINYDDYIYKNEKIAKTKVFKNILIVYISTSKYNNLFNDFKESLQYFLPDCNKTVLILSDEISDNDVIEYNTDKIKYHCEKILHAPWPIITLLKMYYINMFIEKLNLDNITHICYFNANSIILEKSKEYWEQFERDLENYDLFISSHWFSNQEDNYIDNLDTQAAFFLGRKRFFFEFLKDNINILYSNLKENKIPDWHDETIMQYYLRDNKEKYRILEKHFLLNINHETYNKFKDIGFIYLKDKNNDIDKIKYKE